MVSPTRYSRILLLALAALAISGTPPAARAITLVDPELFTGKDAIDPVAGPDAGSVNVTLVAPGAPAKATLVAVPGMRVVRSFKGFEGAVISPVNRIHFADTSLPELVFSINANRGYGGCQAAGAYTSGAVGGDVPGESIYIGDNVNETAYTIEFSKPVAAAGFTVGRQGPTSGVMAAWTAIFYGPDGKALAQQTALPGHGENVAVLFGHVAAPGTTIKRMVFGKASPEAVFVMGNHKIFLDDVAFAPFVPSEPPAGVVKAPVLTRFFDPVGGESIDVPAQGAAPKSFLESLPDFGVVTDWNGFRAKAPGEAPGRNYLDFNEGPDLRFELGGTDRDTRELGGATEAPELATSPGTAVALGGGAGFRYYEITAGLYDAKKNEFLADAGLYAMGFVLTARDVDTQAVATFYNRAGEVLSVQTAAGMRDPANAASPEARRGVELYFGHIASSASDQETWVHRVRIVGRSGAIWGLDDFGFAPGP